MVLQQSQLDAMLKWLSEIELHVANCQPVSADPEAAREQELEHKVC